jgi:hypothetical protein
MAIPSTGPISLFQIQVEFGGSSPISLSEYYRGGANVPESTINQRIPTSSIIRFSDFRGSSKFFSSVTPPINGISTNTFAQDSINQNGLPGVTGSYQKYFIKTFQGFEVGASGTQITVPNMTIGIRGDEREAKIFGPGDRDTGIRNPGVEIVFRQSRFGAESIVGTFRGSGESTDDNSPILNVFVPGGTITVNSVGFYTVRWVADVFSENLGVAPVNIFNSQSFQMSAFGVANYINIVGDGWG